MKRLGIGGTLRASFSVYTSEADVERLAAAVADMKRDL
jgi:selenocysteine lyase/cysteine desulfurase